MGRGTIVLGRVRSLQHPPTIPAAAHSASAAAGTIHQGVLAATPNGAGIAAYDQSKQTARRLLGEEDSLLARMVAAMVGGVVTAIAAVNDCVVCGFEGGSLLLFSLSLAKRTTASRVYAPSVSIFFNEKNCYSLFINCLCNFDYILWRRFSFRI